MSNRSGRANYPGHSAFPQGQSVRTVPLATSSAGIARDPTANTYPNRYVWPDGQQRPPHSLGAGNPAAGIPASLLFAVVVLLMISLTLRQEGNEQGFDVQDAVRLAGYSLAALATLLAIGMGKMRLNLWIGVWTLVPIFIALTAIYAPRPAFALAAGLTHLALLLFAWRIVNRYGQPHAVLAIVLAGTIIGVLSIFTFYALPDIGRSIADTLNSDPGGRMRGVAAQPNSLGTISAITILLAVMHYRAFTARQRVFIIVAICVMTFCLIYSDSRTSIAALLLCLLLWRLCRANAAFNLFAVVGIALVACLLIGFVPDVASYLTREGAGPDELASLNGRARIWAVAWENINSNPILGQGYGASNVILPADDRLFSAALNSHNLYLELLFSGGLVLLTLFAIAVFVSIVRSATRRRAEALIALLFFLVIGAAEVTPYGGLPLFSVFAFYTAVSLCLVRPTPRWQVAGGALLAPVARGQRFVGTPGRRLKDQWI